jgi:hypothetical protein
MSRKHTALPSQYLSSQRSIHRRPFHLWPGPSSLQENTGTDCRGKSSGCPACRQRAPSSRIDGRRGGLGDADKIESELNKLNLGPEAGQIQSDTNGTLESNSSAEPSWLRSDLAA